MNTDKIKGVAKEVAGKVQEQAGKLTGNKNQQTKVLARAVPAYPEGV